MPVAVVPVAGVPVAGAAPLAAAVPEGAFWAGEDGPPVAELGAVSAWAWSAPASVSVLPLKPNHTATTAPAGSAGTTNCSVTY